MFVNEANRSQTVTLHFNVLHENEMMRLFACEHACGTKDIDYFIEAHWEQTNKMSIYQAKTPNKATHKNLRIFWKARLLLHKNIVNADDIYVTLFILQTSPTVTHETCNEKSKMYFRRNVDLLLPCLPSANALPFSKACFDCLWRLARDQMFLPVASNHQ